MHSAMSAHKNTTIRAHAVENWSFTLSESITLIGAYAGHDEIICV